MNIKKWSLEVRIRSIERRLRTLYHRAYARERRANRIKNNERTHQKVRMMYRRVANDWMKISRAVQGIKIAQTKRGDGLRPVYLNPSEFQKLRNWLSTDFRKYNRTAKWGRGR